MTGTAVRLERTIPAPPARVYRAWLDPETLRRWFAPAGWSAAHVEVDERVGGHHRVWHVDPDGTDSGGAECRIVELVPDERIVLDWTFVGPDRTAAPEQTSRLTITLRPVDGGTHLTLVHDRLDGLAATWPEVAQGVEEGWTGTLGRLEDAVRPAMTPAAVAEVLDRPLARQMLERDVLRLAYVATDGTPRCIPIAFHWNGARIVLCTTPNAAKLVALRHRAEVAMTVDTDVHPPTILLLRGRAELDPVDGIPDEYLTISGQGYTMTPEQRVEWEAEVRSLYRHGMVRIVVTPTWAKLIDFESTLPSAVAELVAEREARQHA